MPRPKLPLSPAARASRLRGQVARASVKLRAKRAAAGELEIRIRLTPAEAAIFLALKDAFRGNPDLFAKVALLQGAKKPATSKGQPKPAPLRAPPTL